MREILTTITRLPPPFIDLHPGEWVRIYRETPKPVTVPQNPRVWLN